MGCGLSRILDVGRNFRSYKNANTPASLAVVVGLSV